MKTALFKKVSRLLWFATLSCVLSCSNSLRDRTVIDDITYSIDNHFYVGNDLFSLRLPPTYNSGISEITISKVKSEISSRRLFVDNDMLAGIPYLSAHPRLQDADAALRGLAAPEFLVEIKKRSEMDEACIDNEDPDAIPLESDDVIEILDMRTGTCYFIGNPFFESSQGKPTENKLAMCGMSNVQYPVFPEEDEDNRNVIMKDTSAIVVQTSSSPGLACESSPSRSYFAVSLDFSGGRIMRTNKTRRALANTAALPAFQQSLRDQCIPSQPAQDTPEFFANNLLFVCPTQNLYTIQNIRGVISSLSQPIATSTLLITQNPNRFGYLGYDLQAQSLNLYDLTGRPQWENPVLFPTSELDNTLGQVLPTIQQYQHYGDTSGVIYISLGLNLFRVSLDDIFSENRANLIEQLSNPIFSGEVSDSSTPLAIDLSLGGGSFKHEGDFYTFSDTSPLAEVAVPKDSPRPDALQIERILFQNQIIERRVYSDRQAIVSIDPTTALETTLAVGEEVRFERRAGELFISVTDDNPLQGLEATTDAFSYNGNTTNVFPSSDWIIAEDLATSRYIPLLARVDNPEDAQYKVLLNPTIYRLSEANEPVLIGQMQNGTDEDVRFDRAIAAAYYGSDEGIIEIFNDEDQNRKSIYHLSLLRDCLSDEEFDPGNLLFGPNDQIAENKDLVENGDCNFPNQQTNDAFIEQYTDDRSEEIRTEMEFDERSESDILAAIAQEEVRVRNYFDIDFNEKVNFGIKIRNCSTIEYREDENYPLSNGEVELTEVCRPQ